MLYLAWKEVSRRLGRALLSICGFLLVALLIAAGLCLGDAIKRATTEPLKVTGADLVVIRKVEPCEYREVKRPKDLGAITMEDVARISQIPGVHAAASSLVVWAFRDGKPVVVTGIVPDSVKTGPLRQYRAGERCCVLEEGRFFDPAKDNEAVLDSAYAEQQGVGLGDMVPLGPREFEVVGILKVAGVALIGGGQAYAPLSAVQEMLDEGAIVDFIFVSVDPGADKPGIQEQIEQIVGQGCQVTSQESLPSEIHKSAAVTAAGTNAFVVLILAVGGLLMIRSSLSSVRERVTEIGILRAIGWRKRSVVALLGLEMTYQGVLGAVPGIALGYALAFLVCSNLELSLPASFDSYPVCATTAPALELTLTPELQLSGLLTAFALTVAVALAAGLLAGNYAASRVPMESLRQA